MEFALVAIPLLLILFGSVEFGRAWNNKNDVVHIANEAVRMAAVDQVDCGVLSTDVTSSGLPGATTITITGGNVGDAATATVTAPFSSSLPFISTILDAVGLTELSGTATMRLEQAYDGGACP